MVNAAGTRRKVESPKRLNPKLASSPPHVGEAGSAGHPRQRLVVIEVARAGQRLGRRRRATQLWDVVMNG